MPKITAILLFMILVALKTNAQNHTDNFLKDIFSINNFKINSTLEEVSRIDAAHLSLFFKDDYKSIYWLTNQTVNLPDFKLIDRVTIDTLLLTFEDNKLHDVELSVRHHLSDGIFEKTHKLFDGKYGKSLNLPAKQTNYKKYVWDLGSKECSLNPSGNKGFIVHYGSKISKKRNDWIYKDRKGKGNGTIQLNLSYFEKLLNSDLTVAAFENRLPQWETTGLENHIRYVLNFKTMVDNSPCFSITYNLNDYNIRAMTVDTTSKIITEYSLEKVKNIKVIPGFKKDLEKMNYTMRPQRDTNSDIISYAKKSFMILLNKDGSTITIIKIKLPLP